MNHRHRKTLHALFAHPVSANIDPKSVEAVLKELGAEIEERHGSKFAVTLNGHTMLFGHAHHSLPTSEVHDVKKFLVQCGIDPARDYPL